MNIEEMQRLKNEAEFKIKEILNTFEEVTGMEVFDIDFERLYTLGVERGTITYFNLDVRL